MKAGYDKPAISQRLMERGIDRRDAEEVVESIHRQVMKIAKEEQITFQSILGALIGGSVAAVIGGAIWGANSYLHRICDWIHGLGHRRISWIWSSAVCRG